MKPDLGEELEMRQYKEGGKKKKLKHHQHNPNAKVRKKTKYINFTKHCVG